MLNVTRGRRKAPDRILLMGVEGIGKSTFGSQAPTAVFLDLEDGTNHLDVARLDRPANLAGVYKLLAALRDEPHEFRTLVIDTADALDAMVITKVCADNRWLTPAGLPDIEKPGYGKGYIAVNEEWRSVLLALEALRPKGMEVILLAHAQIKNFSNPAGPDYSRYEPKLSRGSGALVKEWSETILFAIHEEMVRKDGSKMKATSTGRRVIKTERCAAWDAKNRHGLPPELALDYATYAAAREVGLAGQAPDLIAEADELLAQLPAGHPAHAHVAANRDNAPKLAAAVNRLRTIVAQQKEPAHAG